MSQLVSVLRDRPATGLTERISEWNAAPDDADAAMPSPGPNRIEEMSQTSVPLLAPLGGEATTLLPPDHDAPTPASDIQIDPRLPTGFYYVLDVFSESQEETVHYGRLIEKDYRKVSKAYSNGLLPLRG